ncbi:hypothetical protein [Paenibacillus sp. NRS-1780]|uniref:hypothetical protein n=1 Tax=Paenibacillus sp. NRS-1780 TaxID=3233904 RepID=UPI003D2B32FE
MNHGEMNELLELIGEFFPIDITPKKLKAWLEVIGHVDHEQARKAVIHCLQESDFIPRPSQVLKRLPKMNEPVKLSTKEGDFFDHVYRTQSERNAAERRTARELPERPDSIPGE